MTDDKKVYTFRAPRSFWYDLDKCVIIRPDGEVVSITTDFDHTNRRAFPHFRVRAKMEGWKVRWARALLGIKDPKEQTDG